MILGKDPIIYRVYTFQVVVQDFFHQQIAPRWNTAVGRWDSSIRKNASQVRRCELLVLGSVYIMHSTRDFIELPHSLLEGSFVSMGENSFPKGNPSLPLKTCWDWIFFVWNCASYQMNSPWTWGSLQQLLFHLQEPTVQQSVDDSDCDSCFRTFLEAKAFDTKVEPSRFSVFIRQLWHRNWVKQISTCRKGLNTTQSCFLFDIPSLSPTTTQSYLPSCWRPPIITNFSKEGWWC